ncbi:hypothetical protein BD289DRAFT_267004 [Coniella lustricola]|uniref:Uncharacterized protein n=1 Tax=Coniella lustricola TaxID=2025994 RepID=A0A2T3A7B0_9PEZI|nr:hypothetical protein BD289DRAFT_267004 [Coniella lustricola]
MMSAQFSTKEEPISGPSVVLASPEHQEQKDSLSAQQNGGTVSPDVSTTVLPVLRESSLEMIMLEILLELRKLNQTQPVGQSQQEPDSIPREPELPYIPVAGFCSLSDAEYPFWEDPNFERLNIYDLDMNKDLFRHLIVDRRFVAPRYPTK